MKRIFYSILLVSIVFLFLSACGNKEEVTGTGEKNQETEKKEPVDQEEQEQEVDFEGLMERETEVKDFPEWLPQPSEFIVMLDMDMGSQRSVVLEMGESDIPAMVARFNEEFAATGADGLLEKMEDKDPDLYSAHGQISYGEDTVMLLIGEYEPDGALVEGNTGSITYQIYNFD